MAVVQSKTLKKQDEASRSPVDTSRLVGGTNPYPSVKDRIKITPVRMLNEYVAVLPLQLPQSSDVWTPDVKMNQGVVVGVTEEVTKAHGIEIGQIVSYSARTVAVAIDAAGYDVEIAIYSRASLFCVLGTADFVLAK